MADADAAAAQCDNDLDVDDSKISSSSSSPQSASPLLRSQWALASPVDPATVSLAGGGHWQQPDGVQWAPLAAADCASPAGRS